ncbi:variant surface glycoprotein (VSG), putative [Trypanosoma brucei brucei TREU927]|uniref:Variant surface glycoprotein (VSG), putative n=1 Tax=Trypanosoma brucei brucei (strain 927/4 GUTat10.1) TaxID=185431 RepID=Q38G16_TRYB2|nr:variant surface glycoprotein [Trypanosoma brucei brucei TREU927]EAN76254.1 variant surface glycoprotein (VSG), putative [Trypanosoma brucei brucei TREU927]
MMFGKATGEKIELASTSAAITLLICMLGTPSEVDATAGHAIKRQHWVAIFELGQDAEKIPALALTNLRSAASVAEDAFTKLLRALIYAQANLTRRTLPKEKAAWFFLGEEVAAGLAYFKGGKAAADITAARNAGRLQGAITEFIELHAEGSDGTNGCLSADDDGGNPISGKATFSGATTACKANWDDVKAASTRPTVIAANGLVGKLQNGVDHDNLVNGAKQCDINSAKTTFKLSDGASDGTNVGTHIPKMAAGIITVGTTGLEIPSMASVGPTTGHHDFLKSIVQAAKCDQHRLQKAAVDTLAEAQKEPRFKKATKIHLQNKKSDDPDDEDSRERAIKTAYGDDDGMRKVLYAHPDGQPIPKAALGTDADTTLGQITDVGELMRLYFYYSDLNKQKLLEAEKKLQEVETKTATKSAEDKEKECNTKGKDKKEECEKLAKEGCVFNTEAKKCELKKEVKPELEKANQETGKTTTDKCGIEKPPEDCEKVQGTKPKGKNVVCGWIDYIDGKGKVEPACRSSSFLVDKKLALISAAFVSLLF